MSSYKQVQVLKQPKPGQVVTDSSLYWKDYEFPTVINEYGGINHINVSDSKPHNIIATHASRINIYDSRTNSSVKTFSFTENAYSASFRHDGSLVCIGFEDNNAKVFPLIDAANFEKTDENEAPAMKAKKRPLRKFDDHLGPVHVCKFTRSGYQVMTGSDDAHVRIFDLATSNTLMKLKAHKDYVRCGITSQSSDDLILTGSYDNTIKMIDTRTQSIVISVDHGEPIENLVLFPSSNMFISCGGNSIKVWDVLKGGKLMRTMINHHKTVTSLAFSHNCKYLLSGGLDRHVKVFDLLNYDLVQTIDYPSPILSMGILPEDKSLYVGMSDGLLSIRERKTRSDNMKEAKKKYNPYKYISPSIINSSSNDHVIIHQTKQNLKKYDKNLKKFNASKALDAALDLKTRITTPQVTISVMQEIIRRGNIKAALAGKDEKSLSILIKFIQRNISNPNFTATLTDISNFLMEIYMKDIGKYTGIDNLFVRLKQTIDKEIEYQTNLFEIIGTLETIFVSQSSIVK